VFSHDLKGIKTGGARLEGWLAISCLLLFFWFGGLVGHLRFDWSGSDCGYVTRDPIVFIALFIYSLFVSSLN
jgi:hypothetical protein